MRERATASINSELSTWLSQLQSPRQLERHAVGLGVGVLTGVMRFEGVGEALRVGSGVVAQEA